MHFFVTDANKTLQKKIPEFPLWTNSCSKPTIKIQSNVNRHSFRKKLDLRCLSWLKNMCDGNLSESSPITLYMSDKSLNKPLYLVCLFTVDYVYNLAFWVATYALVLSHPPSFRFLSSSLLSNTKYPTGNLPAAKQPRRLNLLPTFCRRKENLHQITRHCFPHFVLAFRFPK